MKYGSLYDMIRYLSYGTKLHIGVLFFGGYGNELTRLPMRQTMHAAEVCDEFKARDGSFRRCYRCRCMAIRKAMHTGAGFGGVCVNGVYEYTHPVMIDGVCASIIYIGNILAEGEEAERIRKRVSDKKELLLTMEAHFPIERCRELASLLDGYIRVLLSATPKNREVRYDPLIENIKSYIESNLEFDIDFENLARMFHYNERYLGRRFKHAVGMSVREYARGQRIERAKQLLLKEGRTVLDIALRTGFNNVTYFNRVFREAVGMTPREYRHQSNQKDD